MSQAIDPIDPTLIDAIVKAAMENALVIDLHEEAGGATLHFKMRITNVTMILGAPNWATVQEALARIKA